ncbi:MAG: S8 family serine peptidase [bacterium]
MRTTSQPAASARSSLATVLAAILVAVTPTARALEIAETRGDFYYDSNGELVGHRNADLPEGWERRPQSHAEQLRAMGITLPPAARALTPRTLPVKPDRVDGRRELSRDKIIVKFVDDVPVRLRQGTLRADGSPLPEVQDILARYPDATLHRVFDTEERILDENRETGQQMSGRALADLNNLYVFTFDTPSERGPDLANEFLALDLVELAYLQAPGEAPGPCADAAPATPNWDASQTYRDPAPTGLDADYAWAYHPGGNGYGTSYWVADLEWDWCFGHEDLPVFASDVLNGASGGSDPAHGTAVLGEIGACSDGFGMTGISPDVTLKMCDFDSELTWAANIQEADAWLVPGEVMLLEIHILGPNSGLTCACNCAQFEFVPVEWDLASFLAIQTATANGIIVVEAGGNGSMNLDSPIYGGWFGNDSGAILVGAGVPGSHSPECWTNYGSRIDLHGWGSGIFSTGYGDLWLGTGDCTQSYTAGFGGTSGASPMIVGAAADLQGISKAKYGITLSPAQVRLSLKINGTPQGSPISRNIGVMPNLPWAINWIEPDVVPSAVPAGWSYPILPRSSTDSNFGYAPLQAGALPGNVAGTYWNWTESNPSYSYTPTINNPRAGVVIDDAWIWFCYNTNMNPGDVQWCGNIGPDIVKGGRHTILNRADVFGEEDEWNEDNDWARQYIWSGLALTKNVPVVRSWDPPRQSTGSGPYYNSEGFSGTTASYWTAFAVLPSDASSDFDVYLNAEAPTNVPQAGFGAAVAISAASLDLSDFVIVDRNVVGPGTYYASAVNWSGFANKIVEYDSDQGVIANPGTNGPYDLGVGEIVDLHEIFLTAGVPTRIQVQWLSGNADYGLSVHQDPTGFTSKWSAVAFADNAGPAQDEWVIVDRTGWHGIAVWKRASADLNQSLAYNLITSPLMNLAPTTPFGWYGPIVPRNTTDSTPDYAPLPAVLYGNQPTTSYNIATVNQGPGDSGPAWQNHLFVDDVWYWYFLGGVFPQGFTGRWINTLQGLDPFSIVRGGRHHLRVETDAYGEQAESIEYDNRVVDWFSWSPLLLEPDAPVARSGGPLKDPAGWGPEWSCDGFSSDFRSYWTAVSVLPFAMDADYDVRVHDAYVGSKDGFNSPLTWSGDAADGAVDFAIVNYNVAGTVPDFSVLNWNATSTPFVVERSEAPVFVASPGTSSYGPYTIGNGEILDLYEVWVPAEAVGLPVHFSIASEGGDADLQLRFFDGSQPYQVKLSAWYSENSGGPGEDEHLPPITFANPGYHCLAVHKTDANDLIRTASYRLVIAVGASAVDAPQVEGAPASFSLGAPRPNPSDEETSIRFDVPARGGSFRIAVYDVNGRRVITLADGERPAGRYETTWNGRDAQGERVGSGVYFVRLEAGTVHETKRITRLQ